MNTITHRCRNNLQRYLESELNGQQMNDKYAVQARNHHCAKVMSVEQNRTHRQRRAENLIAHTQINK